MEGINNIRSGNGVSRAEESSAPQSATDLIREATDSSTGVVDTRHLASMVADAGQQDFEAASEAYSQIEGELSQQSPATAGQFSRDVVDAFAAHSSGGSGSNPVSGSTSQANPILQIPWNSAASANRPSTSPGLGQLVGNSGVRQATATTPGKTDWFKLYDTAVKQGSAWQTAAHNQEPLDKESARAQYDSLQGKITAALSDPNTPPSETARLANAGYQLYIGANAAGLVGAQPKDIPPAMVRTGVESMAYSGGGGVGPRGTANAGLPKGVSWSASSGPKALTPPSTPKALPPPASLKALPPPRTSGPAAGVTAAAPVASATAATTTAATAKSYGVAFFGESNLKYYTGADTKLGGPGKPFFFMPIEDSTLVTDTASAARYTGMAPSAQQAYVKGGPLYGISFPVDMAKARQPTATDAGGWPHYLEGGHTAVRIDGPKGGYLLNPTHEFVVTGGDPMPPGSVLFKLEDNHAVTPIRRY